MTKMPVTIYMDISASKLGEVAAEMKGDQAQSFWFAFVDAFHKENGKINEYALNISTGFGGKRKDIFEKYNYHENHGI